MVDSEEEFWNIPRLRVSMDSDGTPIAKLIGHKRFLDHLYFHGPGILGIYYEYATKQAASFARSWWKYRCGKVVEELPGDYDGIILFRVTSLGDIPREFFKANYGYASRGHQDTKKEEKNENTP